MWSLLADFVVAPVCFSSHRYLLYCKGIAFIYVLGSPACLLYTSDAADEL